MVPTIFMQMFENMGKHLQEIWGLRVPTIVMQKFQKMGKYFKEIWELWLTSSCLILNCNNHWHSTSYVWLNPINHRHWLWKSKNWGGKKKNQEKLRRTHVEKWMIWRTQIWFWWKGLVRQLKSFWEKKLDSFWVASKHEEKQLHPHFRKKKKKLSNAKLKNGNSNIDRVVTIYWKLKDNFKR